MRRFNVCAGSELKASAQESQKQQKAEYERTHAEPAEATRRLANKDNEICERDSNDV